VTVKDPVKLVFTVCNVEVDGVNTKSASLYTLSILAVSSVDPKRILFIPEEAEVIAA
jgi:hypothetical protein